MTTEQLKFEVKTFPDETGMLTKGIFIDDDHFDWGIEEDSIKNAAEHASKLGPMLGRAYMKRIQDEIQEHFIACLSEFINRPVTANEVNEAQRTGFINK